MFINLLIISVIITYIIDYSGFVPAIKSYLVKLISKGKFKNPETLTLKPFDCSLCMSFWVGLIYVSICDFTLLNLLYIILASYLTAYITPLFYLLKDIYSTGLARLENLLNSKR